MHVLIADWGNVATNRKGYGAYGAANSLPELHRGLPLGSRRGNEAAPDSPRDSPHFPAVFPFRAGREELVAALTKCNLVLGYRPSREKTYER